MHKDWVYELRFCKLSLPLIIRLFEYIRETNLTDEDLHFMAERISELGWDGVNLTMNQYQSIIPPEKMLQSNYEYNQTTLAE
jgi:hypothetical protein